MASSACYSENFYQHIVVQWWYDTSHTTSYLPGNETHGKGGIIEHVHHTGQVEKSLLVVRVQAQHSLKSVKSLVVIYVCSTKTAVHEGGCD